MNVVKMKAAQVICETMIKQGVDVIFGITGGAIMPLYDQLYDYDDKIRNIISRHEQGAVHAAEGYARASGKVGTALATSGPGGTNLVTGVMDAFMDSVPVVAMAGQVATSLIGNDAFQETDMMGITMPITKHSFQLRNPNEAAATIIKAYKLANTGRPGPVYIDLPKDIQNMEVTERIPDDVDMPTYRPTIKPNPLQLKKAAELIMKAERPVILAGGGVNISYAHKELLKFAESLWIPVATTTMGKGCFPEDHPLSLGVTGMHGTEHANWALINTDLLIAIGSRFSDRVTGEIKSFEQGKKIIHIDIDPSEIGKNVRVHVPIVGDVKPSMEGIANILLKEATKHKNKDSEWNKKVKELKGLCHKAEEDYFRNEKLSTPFVLNEMNKILKDTDIVTTGVGQHQMFGEHFLMRRNPRTWITSGGAGTMGFGFPAALGAKIAKPNVEVFDIDGDGSFQMTAKEMATAKENDIKVVTMIMNNGYLGMVRQWLEIFYEKRYSGVYYTHNPDFVKMSESFGLSGISIESKDDVLPALKKAITEKETIILDFHVDSNENILPMLPPGKSLKDIIGGKVVFKNWPKLK